MYAVIKTGGKQYRVAPGDTIRIERVDGKVGKRGQFWLRPGGSHGRQESLGWRGAGKASVSGQDRLTGSRQETDRAQVQEGGQYKIFAVTAQTTRPCRWETSSSSFFPAKAQALVVLKKKGLRHGT